MSAAYRIALNSEDENSNDDDTETIPINILHDSFPPQRVTTMSQASGGIDLLRTLDKDFVRFVLLPFFDTATLACFAQTCKYWRNTINSYPELWIPLSYAYKKDIEPLKRHIRFLELSFPRCFIASRNVRLKRLRKEVKRATLRRAIYTKNYGSFTYTSEEPKENQVVHVNDNTKTWEDTYTEFYFDDEWESYCPSRLEASVEKYRQIRNVVLRRIFLFDTPKMFLYCISFVFFLFTAYITLLCGSIVGVLYPIFEKLWILYIFLGFFAFATLQYTLFVGATIFLHDYQGYLLRFLRGCSFLENRTPLYILGTYRDSRVTLQNAIAVEFLLHLYWIPLLVLLVTIKLIHSPNTTNWSIWFIPVASIWLLYILSFPFNAFMDSITQFCERKRNPLYKRRSACQTCSKGSYFLYHFIHLVPFYLLLGGASCMILGKLDGWLHVPWSVAFIPFYFAFFFIMCFSVCSPCMKSIMVNLNNSHHQSPYPIWTLFSRLLDIFSNLDQCLGGLPFMGLSFRLWPAIVGVSLAGLKLDNVISIHWAFIFCPPLAWFVIQTLIFLWVAISLIMLNSSCCCCSPCLRIFVTILDFYLQDD